MQIIGRDVFKVLGERSVVMAKTFKSSVKESLRVGKPISADISISTRSFSSRNSSEHTRINQYYVTHWTPVKDEKGAVRFVIVTFTKRS
jgi:hypothetical protein